MRTNLHGQKQSQYLNLFRSEIYHLECRLRHTEQRLFWPFSEPVDGTAVHKGGKHATTRPEGAANGAHAQHDVQVAPGKHNSITLNFAAFVIWPHLKQHVMCQHLHFSISIIILESYHHIEIT